MEKEELTPMEALKILYDERAFAYDEKVHSKSKSWSEDIKHYDRIGEALIALKNSLEKNEELKHKLKQYKDIDKELGIDLITLVKVLKNGIHSKRYGYLGSEYLLCAYECIYYFEDINNYVCEYYYDEYGKTWALTKEELEESE